MTGKHPLQDFVLAAFAKHPTHTIVTLGEALSPETVTRKTAKAYLLVALDVLLHLKRQGLIERDATGWFRLAKDRNPAARPLH